MTTIISLDDVKTQLQIDDTFSDAVIRTWLEPTTRAVERYLHEIVAPRTITDELEIYCARGDRGRNRLPSFRLWQVPVLSLTSATDVRTGVGYDISGWRPSPSGSGLVRIVSGVAPAGLTQMVYEAGQDPCPPDYKQGALVVLQHCWETRRGAGQIGAGVIGPEEHYDPRIMIGIPRKAWEWLGPPRPTVG